MNAIPRRLLAGAALTLAASALPACAAPPDRADAPASKPAEPTAKPVADAARPATPADPEAEAEPDPVAIELLEAHNRERAKAKLPPLKLNAKLTAAARVQARDMAEHAKMQHEGTDGSTPPQRLDRQGYHGRGSGENVAYGSAEVPGVLTMWMDSPPHKKNILGDFGELGGARATAEDGTPYWCVDFGNPWPELDTARAAPAAIAAINEERAGAELPPLKAAAKLAAVARRQARTLAGRKKLDPKEDGPDSPFRQIQASGYRFRAVSLAYASGTPTAAEVVRDWLDNKGQKEALLGDFTEVGLGVAVADDGRPYWCLILATPLK